MLHKRASHHSFDGIPENSLTDERLSIRYIASNPGELVTIRLTCMDDEKKRFESYGIFEANEEGIVDLAKAKPMEGTYAEADPMGLFWSMKPAKNRASLFSKTSSEPINFHMEAFIEGVLVAEAEIVRSFYHTDKVKRKTLNEKGLIGSLYAPMEEKKLPGVILLGGSDGAVHEQAAALLANRGYAVLALAYFGVEGLPDGLVKVPLEYFRNAMEWLGDHPQVDSRKMAVAGFSRGAELVLLLGATFPEIKAVIAAAPSAVIFPGLRNFQPVKEPAWTYQGEEITYFPLKSSFSELAGLFKHWIAGKPISNLSAAIKALQDEDAVSRARIPVEHIQGTVMLISGGDDQVTPASYFSSLIKEKLSKNERHIHLDYEEAGHFLSFPYTLPYLPTNTIVTNRLKMTMTFGGMAEANAKAAIDAWPKIVAFLDGSLNQ